MVTIDRSTLCSMTLRNLESEAMKVSVKLVGLFQAGRFRQQECDYPAGTTVDDVVADLQLPRQHFGIILINGSHAAGDTVLLAGDRLVLMPVVDGG